jgi:adenine C2-methylase RlmN of 23S rRNA A2503 and tRNA A37
MNVSTNNSLIKNQKPKLHSHYHQGIIDPRTCNKLYESCANEKIIYRSGLEYKFIKWCEANERIVKWASEPICIEYVLLSDQRKHKYFPDFIFETIDGKKYIVEIKPYAQTKQPKSTSSNYEKRNWVKNISKWNAVKEFVKTQKNTEFIIITEKFF